MSFLRASLLMGSASMARIAAAIAVTKIFALHVGPGGLALLGQVTSLGALANGIVSGGTAQGVTRYFAQIPPGERRAEVATAALSIFAATAAACVLLLIAFGGRIAASLLGAPELTWVVWLLAGACLLAGLNTLLVALLNGLEALGAMAAVTMAAAGLSFCLAALLTWRWGLAGALASVCLAPAAGLPFALRAVARRFDLRAAVRARHFRWHAAMPLLRYSAMALASAILAPLAALAVRDCVASGASWREAGHWQAVWRISETWSSVAAAVVGSYLLPRYASSPDAARMGLELRAAAARAIPVAATSAVAIYLLREPLLLALFSTEFLPAAALFAFQLAGDFLKVLAWLFAYALVARAMTRAYVACEALCWTTLVVMTTVLVPGMGARGATVAYAIAYAVYLAAVASSARRALTREADE